MKYPELISKLKSFDQELKYVFVKNGLENYCITSSYNNYINLSDTALMNKNDEYFGFYNEQKSWTVKNLIVYLSDFEGEVDFGNAVRVGHVVGLYVKNDLLHIEIENSKEMKNK